MKKNFLMISTLALVSLLTACVDTKTSFASASNSGKASTSESTETPSANSSDTNKTSDSTSASSDSFATDNGDGTKTFCFEAEYNPNIENMTGPAFSGTYTGTDMIVADSKNYYDASNGFFVVGLAKKGQRLDFSFNSDADITDAVLTWRISNEAFNITLKPGVYDIYINGTSIAYKDIVLDDVPGYQQGYKKFEDYPVTKRLKIKKGENVISFVTNNATAMGGDNSTFTATAPWFDCFKIKTSATLSWEPDTDNLLDK